MQNKFYKSLIQTFSTKMMHTIIPSSSNPHLTEDKDDHDAQLPKHTPNIFQRQQTLENRTQQERQPEVDQTTVTSIQIESKQ